MRFLIFFFFFLFFFFQVDGQDLHITYKLDVSQAQKDIEYKISQNEANQGVLLTKEALQLLKNYNYSLFITNNQSHFILNNNLLADNHNSMIVSIAKAMTDKGEFFQNLKENKVLKRTTSFGKKFLIESKLDGMDWELTNESKIINGFKSYKAKASIKDLDREGGYRLIDIIVWYTPEIPFPFGPEGFGGLPGLILEKCQGTMCLKIDNLVSENVAFKFPKGKTTNYEDYFVFLEEIRAKRN